MDKQFYYQQKLDAYEDVMTFLGSLVSSTIVDGDILKILDLYLVQKQNTLNFLINETKISQNGQSQFI